MLVRITSLFPLWALLFSLAAYGWPGAFTGAKPMIVPLLGIVMLGMGMTLTWSSFRDLFRRSAAIGLGVALQYLIMPFLAWGIALVLDLPPHLMAGLVLLPVFLGVLINSLAGHRLRPVKQVFPLLSVAAIVFIIAIIVALNRGNLAAMGWAVALAVLLHNAGGLATGYGTARLLGWDERTARTLAIEVGMQNSGLAVALAVKYFAASAALPGALFSIRHNLTGSLLAAYWSRRMPSERH